MEDILSEEEEQQQEQEEQEQQDEDKEEEEGWFVYYKKIWRFRIIDRNISFAFWFLACIVPLFHAPSNLSDLFQLVPRAMY